MIMEMKKEVTFQHPNEQGYYGSFGGAYIPEMLHRNVEELKEKYLDIMYERSFTQDSTSIFLKHKFFPEEKNAVFTRGADDWTSNYSDFNSGKPYLIDDTYIIDLTRPQPQPISPPTTPKTLPKPTKRLP